MQAPVDEQVERVHLFVAPEENLPPKPDYVGRSIIILCSLFLVGIIALSVFSPKTEPTVSFITMVTGFQLAPVRASETLTIKATGKGHVNATFATGTITFYNGQVYTQIIPVGTILKGADNVSVVTDAQAVIPPAAQTTPPTYGQVSVAAHALQPGTTGNIEAGDINEPCCVTSVIAQNPYSFTGGKGARDFTYLTAQDVASTASSLTLKFEQETKTLFASKIILDPICTTTSKSVPSVGSQTQTAHLTLATVCTAISYSVSLVKNRIIKTGQRFGELSNIQFSIVEIKGVVLTLYVVAVVKPVIRVPFR